MINAKKSVSSKATRIQLKISSVINLQQFFVKIDEDKTFEKIARKYCIKLG